MSVNQQDIKGTDFVIQSDNNIPVYNVLLAGHKAGQDKEQDFSKQFQLPKPDLIRYQIDVPIQLSDFTYYKHEIHPINIFTEQTINRSGNKEKVVQRVMNKTKSTEPHRFSPLKAQTIKTDSTLSLEQQLRPVPLVKLNKKQQSYTKELNPVIGYNPISVGFIEASDSMIGIVIGFVLFFMYIRMAFGKQVKTFFGIVFNYQRADNIQKDNGLVTKRASFLINILFFLTLGLLFLHQLDYMGLSIASDSQIHGFAILSILVIVAYTLKWLFAGILAHILKIQDLNKAYFFHIFVYNKLFALIGFPIILALPYINNNWVGIILPSLLYFAIILYVLRVFRILILSVQRKLSIFYLFLYLCALEIAPVWVMIITVQGWLNVSAL